MADLEGILERLIKSNVAFVIVGGYAAVAHGCTMITMDVDICCDMSADNLLKLQKALSILHPVHRLTPKRIPLNITREKCRGIKNIYLDTDCGQLDCLGEIKGIGDFKAVEAISEQIEWPSGRCLILSLDGLIKAKKAMDRPRDRETVIQLEALKEKKQRKRYSS